MIQFKIVVLFAKRTQFILVFTDACVFELGFAQAAPSLARRL